MAAVPPQKSDADEDRKPAAKDFKGPVGWLFGRQFIAALKWMLVYAAFKGKIDPRDWMAAECIPATDAANEIDKFWRQWNPDWDPSDDGNPESEKEFWFDYISDTGDGQRAVYSIAYLCMSDLVVANNPKRYDPVEFASAMDPNTPMKENSSLLKRGTFLFVGGDTSYHISDYANLANRFQNPFRWAHDDLKDAPAQSAGAGVPHPLLGIPGNHDYYDAIDGFNRQFRRPASDTNRRYTGSQIARPPLLMIPTFGRYQEASYFALRLPFDWWFWGMDTEKGEIDFRQMEFFDSLKEKHHPKKLIVSTPEPTTVFGKFSNDDSNQSKTFEALGIERPFLKDPEPMGEGKCRLDLSGDIHHYARHWGPSPDSQSAGNYASVVSGGGGAFFHPTHTDVGEVTQQALYPPASVSRKRVAAQLFKIQNIFKGGLVWLFGFLIAFILFFSASFPKSTRDAYDSFPPFINIGISPPVEASAGMALNARTLPDAYKFWAIALIVSVGLVGAALFYSINIFKKEYDPKGNPKAKEVKLKRRLVVWALAFSGFAVLAYGVLGFRSFEANLTRYMRSVIILAALIWAVLAIIESIRYSAWLNEEAYRVNIERWHYWPVWTLTVLAIVGFGAAVWFFGSHESAYLVSDLMQLTVLLLVGGGLAYFAYGTGGKLSRGVGKLGFLLLGVSHAFLQLAIPFLFVRKGHLLWAVGVSLFIIAVFQFIGRWLAGLKSGWPLAIAWVLLGATILVVPFLLPTTQEVLGVPLNMPEGTWERFLLCFYAGAIGAMMSCVLFGWYLAVSLAFNGHNNEAGGAARIEGFKQLIRFRLNRQGLTAYVIGIDEPATDGRELRPKIIDTFHIRP